MELLVLGALHYLSHGWTFDYIDESTAIDHDVHCVFLHHFIEFGSTVLFNKYVIIPVHLEEALSNMHKNAAAGCLEDMLCITQLAVRNHPHGRTKCMSS